MNTETHEKMKRLERGQAMLLTVLAIGGAILGATAIAGTLMVYQIRATTDSAHSAQAIFAADTGIGWAEFDYYCGFSTPSKCVNAGEQPAPVFLPSSDASVTVTCYDASNSPVLCSDTTTAVSAVSKGVSLSSARAFIAGLQNATSFFP